MATQRRLRTLTIINADVNEFQISLLSGVIFGIAALIFGWFVWIRTDGDVEFANPIFPTLGCASIVGDGQQETMLPPPETIELCNEEGAKLEEKQEVQYPALIESYRQVELTILANFTPPERDWSVFRAIQAFAALIGFILPFIFYSAPSIPSEQTKIGSFIQDWHNARTKLDRIWIVAIHIIVALIMACLMWLGTDVVWFFFGRSVLQPLNYSSTTTTLFTTLIVSLIAFFVAQWSINIGSTDISGLAIVILLLGIVAGMFLTNNDWSAANTNAFSNMSKPANDYRMAYIIDGVAGSRTIFRATFIAVGVLLIIFSYEMHNLIHTLKDKIDEQNVPEDKNAKTNWIGEYKRFFNFWRKDTDSGSNNILRPHVLLVIGVLAGILVAFIGYFPSNSETWCLLKGSICIDKAFLHKCGAIISPILLWIMMMVFPLVAHPRRQKQDSYHSKYYLHLGRTGFWLAIFVIVVLIPLILLKSREQPVGVATVEYFILIAFSVFLYAFSLYTREYFDDLREEGVL